MELGIGLSGDPKGRAGFLAVAQKRRHEERKGVDEEEVTEPWRWVVP